MPARAAGEKRFGIVGELFSGKSRNRFFVAADFHIPAHQFPGEPDQRMEPEEDSEQLGREQREIISSAYVIPFVQQNVFPVFRICRNGEIYPGAEHSSDESSLYLIRRPDVRLLCSDGEPDASADSE